jgi:hypothetical protein
MTKVGKTERLIYCGPNIPGGALQKYTVFKGGLPVHLEDIFERCPVVKNLFVPVQDLARVEQAIATKGTPEQVYYQEVVNILRGGV